MQNVIFILGLLLYAIFVQVPQGELQFNKIEQKEIKQTINLASKVLVNSIDLEGMSYEVFSLGYYLENEDLVKVDKERLIREFNDVLYKDTLDVNEFKEMQRRIPVLFLTYGDRFYVAEMRLSMAGGGQSKNIDDYDITYAWLPPIYYTVIDDMNRLVYVNLRDETSYFYQFTNQGEVKVDLNNKDVRVKGKPLTKELRDQIVIDSINSIVLEKTRDPVEYNNGFKINIRPAGFEDRDTSQMNSIEMQEYYKQLRDVSNFNVLDGITFFIVYSADERLYVQDMEYRYRNYNASGFTLSKRY